MTDIAIVGMGCRFPGGVRDVRGYWDFLLSRGDGIVEVPSDRWNVDLFYDADPDVPGRMYTRRGGFLSDSLWEFDAEFFGISPREASVMDVQQRLLLEVAWEALDDAGAAARVSGREVGVYVGGFMNDNQIRRHMPTARHAIGQHTGTSGTLTMLSNRISYVLDLRGPSMTIDTACSSSLVAIHQAVQALTRGECEIAVAGGVNAMLHPETSVAMCKSRLLSRDGRCKSFDASADGYGRGEGAGATILKPLAQAVRDGDRVYAVIRGTGSNQDGRTNGITVPSASAQSDLVRRVCASAGIEPHRIGYVEAHGTGTAVGDPIEMAALGAALGAVEHRGQPLLVGSVKAAIGHLEAAAGVAGVIKAALTVHHGTVVPQAWLDTLNPAIPFEELNLRVATDVLPLPTERDEAFAAVNGFGYGGSNAHVVIGRAPTAPVAASARDSVKVLPVSAVSPVAVGALASALRGTLEANPAALDEIRDAAWQRRAHHDVRTAVAYRDADDLAEALRTIESDEGKKASRVLVPAGTKPVFVFSGMGPQWWGMGRDLLSTQGPFAEAAHRIDAEFQKIAGWSVIEELLRDEATSRITRTEIAQPANFLIQSSLVAQLDAYGIRPAAVVGHSVGEVASAYVSGALSLTDALHVSHHRARLQATTAGSGGMLAVGVTEAEARHLVFWEDDVCVAAVNGTSSVTLAGDTEALKRLEQDITEMGKFARMLRVEVPYHSPMMDRLLPELDSVLGGLRPVGPTLPLYSTVTGAQITDEPIDGGYWRDNVRERVRFADAIRALIADGHQIFLEVGPHPVLLGNVNELLIQAKVNGRCFGTLTRNQKGADRLVHVIADLYTAGALDTLDVPGARGRIARHTDLPAYPWQRRPMWSEDAAVIRSRLGTPDLQPLLGERLDTRAPEWETRLSGTTLPWLRDHVVEGLTVLPATAYLDAALSAAAGSDRTTIALADVSLVTAMVIDDHDAPALRMSLDERTSEFAVRSRSSESGAEWTTHATGRVLSAVVEPSVDVTEPEPDAVAVSADRFYQQLADSGLHYGPHFRRVIDARISTGAVHAAIDAAGSDGTAHVAHPAVVDAALQCVAMLVLGSEGALGGAIVPVHLDQVRWFAPFTPKVTAVARLRDGDGLRADVALLSDAGEPFMELVNVEFRQVSPPLDPVVELEGLFYETVWEKVPGPDVEQAHGQVSTTAAVVVDLGAEPSERARQVSRWFPHADLLRLPAADPAALSGLAATMGNHALRPDVTRVMIVVVADSASGDDVIALGTDTVNRLVATARTIMSVVETPEGDGETDGRQPSPAETFSAVFRGLILTDGVFRAADEAEPPALASVALVGARRALRNEQGRLLWRLVDAPPTVSADAIRAEVLSGPESDDEVRLTAHERMVPRVRRTLPDQIARFSTPVPVTDEAENFALEVPKSGLFADLAMRACARVAPRQGEVELRVDTVGINYKDSMKVLGILGSAELSGTYFETFVGMEAFAVVTRVGLGVTELQPGDRMLVCRRDMFRRYLTTRVDSGLLLRCPDEMLPEHASSLVPMITAQYGLHRSARLALGETVLVHGAAGGSGLAAIQVAKALGATVIGSAGTPERRSEVLAAGADHVVNSRSIKFVEDVRRLTEGHGVDVVFNSAPGEMIRQNMHVTAESGRIVDIGKADVYGGSVISLADFDRNITFSAIDLDRILKHRPDVFRDVANEVLHNIQDGTYRPLPATVYGLSRIADAFDAVARSQHVGRVALDLTSLAEVLPRRTDFRVREDATYLVTGGFGAFGLATARWLAGQGARRLVLVSRSGPTTGIAKETLHTLRTAGVDVVDATVDVGDHAAVAELIRRLARTAPPLRGVFHTAGVIEDEPVSRLTAESLERVIRPKAGGAWNLHLALEEEGVDVDAFVLYSSISAVAGEVPQVSYASANVMLNAIGALRRTQGRPALSVNWGSLNGGMAVSSDGTERYLAYLGYRPIDMDRAAVLLRECLGFGESLNEVCVVDADWAKWAGAHPETARTARFSELVTEGGSTAAVSLEHLAAMPEAERREVLENAMAEQLATVLGVGAETIDGTRSFLDLGLDSLMVVEFSARVRSSLGIEIPTLEANRGTGLSALVKRMAARIEQEAGSTALNR